MRTPILICAALLAHSARGDPSATISLKVSLDGATWRDTVNAAPGQTVQGAIFVGFSGAAALASIEQQIRIGTTDLDPLIQLSGAGLGPIAPFTAGFEPAGVFSRPDGYRIDRADDFADNPALGILSAQLPRAQNPAFSTSNPALVYRFSFTPSPRAAGTAVQLFVPLAQVSLGRVGLYPTPDAPAPIYTTDLNANGSTIFLGGGCGGPDILQYPRRTTAREGQRAEFSVVAFRTYGFQWRRDGIDVADSDRISGATTERLVIDPVTADDAGEYTVVIRACPSDVETSPVPLYVLCAADVNTSFQIDFFDYLDFLRAFDAGEPLADFNRDDQIDAFDYLDFLDAFIACGG